LLLHRLANLLGYLSDNSGALGDAVSGALLLCHHVVGYLAVRDRVVIGPRITIPSPMSSVPISSVPISMAIPRISFSISFSFSNWRAKCRRCKKKKRDRKSQTKVHTAQLLHLFCLFLQSFL